MGRPVIALITDFGTRDHYVGTMKGVVLGICPDATLVDITHAVAPQDISGAALELAASYPFFPPGTTFLVVVDPGVGSTRRAVAIEAHGCRFVGPDNGVLSPACATGAYRAVELTNPRYARAIVSRTFEGRDRFAPAAAWLAAGAPFAALGAPVTSIVLLDQVSPRVTETSLMGAVVRVDVFGNLVTNIDRQTFARWSRGEAANVTIGTTSAAIVHTYADAPVGAPCALFGSTDHLEVAINGGNAANVLGVGRGGRVEIVKV